MALKLNAEENSSEPPHTTTEEEPDSPKTAKKKIQKIERKKRYQKEKQQRQQLQQQIDKDIASLICKHQGPYKHIWDLYPSLKFDSNRKCILYNVSYPENILNPKLIVEPLANRNYKVKYYYSPEYMKQIGKQKKKSFYGIASTAAPKFSCNFDEENEILKIEMCKDMIVNIYRYHIAKKKQKTIIPYTYMTPSHKSLYGPGRFKHEYFKMEENYMDGLTEPIFDSDEEQSDLD